jgi:hypothetical protein
LFVAETAASAAATTGSAVINSHRRSLREQVLQATQLEVGAGVDLHSATVGLAAADAVAKRHLLQVRSCLLQQNVMAGDRIGMTQAL